MDLQQVQYNYLNVMERTEGITVGVLNPQDNKEINSNKNKFSLEDILLNIC
jgi:hypothetical protein